MPSVDKAIINPFEPLDVGEALLVAVSGLLVVFVMLAMLMAVILVISKIVGAIEGKGKAPAAPPPHTTTTQPRKQKKKPKTPHTQSRKKKTKPKNKQKNQKQNKTKPTQKTSKTTIYCGCIKKLKQYIVIVIDGPISRG